MVRITIDCNSPETGYKQVYRRLREAILTGELISGVRLPSTRILAGEAGVARVTISRAYEQLAAEGFVESRVGAGTYVAAKLPTIPEANATAFKPVLTSWGQRAIILTQQAERGRRWRPPDIYFGFGPLLRRTFSL